MILSPPRRTLASTLSGTLVAAALAVAGVATTASPAAAADPAPVLMWEVSQQFDDHLSTHVLTDGATEDGDGVVTFPAGEGTYNPDNGTTKVTYDGQVAGSFVMVTTTYYTVTIADPVITIDDEGNGEMTAMVSASNAAGMGQPADSTDPSRVLVTTFDATSWVDGGALDSMTVTPDWAGVLPADSAEATALEIPSGQPVDGKAFNPAFLGQVTKGVRAHFYASGSGSDPKKQPASITFQAAPMTVDVSTDAASPEGGLDLDIAGTGFTGTDGNPGDDGVYVGLAPSGGLPDVSSPGGIDSFAGASWVPASGIVSGAFSTSLNAPTDALDPSQDYSIYTWRAHGHSTTSQDTETPVEIDWSQLEETPSPAASNVTTSGPATKVFGASATLTATVPGTGSVTLTGVGPAQTKDVAAGAVSFTVPASLAAGQYTATFAYSGDAAYLPSQATKGLTVTKAAPKVKGTWKKKPTTKKRGKLSLVVAGPASVTAPSGDVVVKVSSKGVKHKLAATLVNGKVKVKLPKLAVGVWKVKLIYPGTADYLSAKKKLQVKVKNG